MFNFCNQVTVSFKSQWGSRLFEHTVVELLSTVVICYHNNYSSYCVFPYFPIEWVDASRQSLATYLATDSLRLRRSCKRAFKVVMKKMSPINYLKPTIHVQYYCVQYISKCSELCWCNDNILWSVLFIEHSSQYIEHPHYTFIKLWGSHYYCQ